MDFNDFWINNNDKKEQLNNAKHGVRKEQVDKKFHNLFDAYDTNGDGTLETEELEGLFTGLTKFSGRDKTLDVAENKQVASLFANQVGIKDADFMGFVKSVSTAAQDIISSETTPTSDGGKEVKTTYKDGTVETISYYPDGDYKFKKLDKETSTTTNYYTIGDNLDKHYSEEEIEERVQKSYEEYVTQITQNAKKNKANEGKIVTIMPNYNDFKHRYLKHFNINKCSSTNNFERHDFELSERGKSDVAVRDFVLRHYIETHNAVYDALDTMGILDDIGAAINAGAGEVWNSIKNVWNGTDEEYENFYELVKIFKPNYDNSLQIKETQEFAQKHPENYFRGETGKIDTDNGAKFQQTTEQYQNAQILHQRLDILNKAMREISMYQSEQDALTHAPAQSEGMNPASHILNANNLLLQYFDGDKEAVKLLLNGTIGNAQATITAIKGIADDTQKMFDSVTECKSFDEIKNDYQSQYKEIYGTDFVPDELTEKVMEAKATGGMVKLAAITIVSILITKSPIMAEISAAAGGAEVTGAAANMIRTLVSRYGATAVQQGIKFAMTSGTLATDVGLTLLNQVTSERGVDGEELLESTKGSAKYIYFGAYVGAPLAQAVSKQLGKIGATAKIFEGGVKTANGAIQTTSIAGDKLVQNLMKGGNRVLTTGGAFLTDVAAFSALEVATEGMDPVTAGKEQTEMLGKLKIMNHFIEYMLGGKVHAGMNKAKMDAVIEQSGVKNWQIKEIKSPNKTVYEVEVGEGLPKVRFGDKNQLATAMLEKIAGNYKSIESFKINDKPEKQTDKSDSKLELEGKVYSDELTEVAPFARYLSPHEKTDPIQIITDNLDIRVNSANFDLSRYETTGLPLKYSRQEFTQNLKNLVNEMKIEDQNAILKKFNIQLIYTVEGFELEDIPKIPQNNELKTPLDRAVKAEIERFTQENEFVIDNPEVKVFLDDFIKIAPEFLFTVGKKQHGTHVYTLDVHTLKVLQNAIKHSEYKNLSSEDKMVLNTAILLHDIGKRYIDEKTADEDHAGRSYSFAIGLLDRFNLSSDIKQRVVKLIENHEFYKQYNDAYKSFKNEEELNAQSKQECEEYGWSYTPKTDYKNNFDMQVRYTAGKFVNRQDLTLAKLLTYADLKSVNPEQKFVQNEWNNKTKTRDDIEYQGSEKLVTRTHSETEFREYIDESFSYVDKELSKYENGRIDDELVYPSELLKTSNKLFGYETFFDRVKRNFNSSYGVHRSDYEACIEMRQLLIDAGFKPKEAVRKLKCMLKYDNNDFDLQKTREYVQAYLENRDFIETHNIRDDFRDANEMRAAIDLIKQKENLADIFAEFGVKDQYMRETLSNTLYIDEYQKGTFFNQEAYDAMVELFRTKKYTPEQINKIIFNSFSIKNHRGNFRDNRNDNSEFNKQIMDTILELAKDEPLDNAISDAHLCFDSATPESGWVLVPEFLQAVKEFNQIGIKNKSFISSLFDKNFKDGANKYDPNRVLESVTRNEKYENAIKFAKLGFEGEALSRIINTYEIVDGKVIYSQEVQSKIAELIKRGVFGMDVGSECITRQLFDGDNKESWKFNNENYDFVIRMLDSGIKSKDLDSIIYQSGSSTFHAREAAPDKILESGRFSKAQVEAMVNFFKEIGFDKIPWNSTSDSYRALAESFMDVVELTPEESAKMVDFDCFGGIHKISKMNNYMAPFRYVNQEKYNQALSYYKKGVNIRELKELTAIPELYETLKSEPDLSYIKTPADATLVANFLKYKDIKSIEELSPAERMNLMTLMMINKTAFANNNVSEKIPLLPTSSEGYAQMMSNFAHSFGYDKAPYSNKQVSNINKNFLTLIERLQSIKPSEITLDSDIELIKQNINNILPELKLDTRILQRVVKSPEFKNLSDKDKSILTFATLFSCNKENSLDSAIEASVYAKRMGMSDTDAMKIYVIVKNSHLVETFMSQERRVKVNDSRSYATIKSTLLNETFETAALELKNYNNFPMAKMLYTANENYFSLDMLKEYAPDLYQEFLSIRKTVPTAREAIEILSKNPAHSDRIEEIKLKAADKYAPSRHLNKMLKDEIHHIKASDVLLPQTDMQNFIKTQSSEWIREHTKKVNGREVLVISSDEIPDFFHLSHTTQAFEITGKADVTTNISNFEAFAMLFDNKTVCLSYSATGKTAVVGTTGLLIRTDNTSQYLARGTDISSISKDIPSMVSEYISRRALIDQGSFQSKRTKDYDRQYFASMIKEEMQPGYRALLDKKLSLEEEIRNGNDDLKTELKEVNDKMRNTDDIYIQKLDKLIKKANGETIDIQFIRENDAELGAAYDRVLSYINTEHRGNDGLMRTMYHNEVLASNTVPVGIFVTSEKTLFELTDDYLQYAQDKNLPIVILK